MADTVSITLTARDLATPAVVEAVTKQTAALNQLTAAGQGITTTLTPATAAVLSHGAAHQVSEGHVSSHTRAIRELVSGLATSLSPALAQVEGQTLSVRDGLRAPGRRGPAGRGGPRGDRRGRHQLHLVGPRGRAL